MAQYKFGTGNLYAIGTAANATPIQFGALQDVSIDVQFSNKELYGQNIFALAVGRAQGKVTGKAKFAQVNGLLYNSIFFGGTLTTGQTKLVNGEAGTIPTTPYQVTVVNAATFVQDYGVLYTATGLPLTKVASAPITGQYSVSNVGVYTFAAVDTGLGVSISYSYTVAASGTTIALNNQLQGVAPTIQIAFNTIYNGKNALITLPSCISTKLMMPSKMADWNIDEFDFDAFAAPNGNVINISMSE
jgi:hypothetical protein